MPEPAPNFSVIRATALCCVCRYDLVGLSVVGACPECGTAIVRSVPACPRCWQSEIVRPLTLRESQNGRVWRCEGCGGLGFERGRLASAVAGDDGVAGTRPARGTPDLTSQTSVRCRGCDVPMTALMIDGRVMIDRCERCGSIWLDAGEFAAVAAFIKETLGSRRLPKDAEHLLGDRRALLRALGGGDMDSKAADIIETLATFLWFI